MCIHRHFPEDDGVVVDLVSKGVVHDSVPGQENLPLVQTPVAGEVPRSSFGESCENPCGDWIHQRYSFTLFNRVSEGSVIGRNRSISASASSKSAKPTRVI